MKSGKDIKLNKTKENILLSIENLQHEILKTIDNYCRDNQNKQNEIDSVCIFYTSLINSMCIILTQVDRKDEHLDLIKELREKIMLMTTDIYFKISKPVKMDG